MQRYHDMFECMKRCAGEAVHVRLETYRCMHPETSWRHALLPAVLRSVPSTAAAAPAFAMASAPATPRSKGLEPHVTLHHFVHPAWFEKMGGFAKEGEECCCGGALCALPTCSWFATLQGLPHCKVCKTASGHVVPMV